MQSTAKSFSDIFKFNPYHDRLGRFTTAGGATSMTLRTRSSLWQKTADKAIEREKERTKGKEKLVASTKGMAKRVLDSNSISTDKKECEKDIDDLYKKIAYKDGITWNAEKGKFSAKRGAIDETKKIARKIMEKQKFEDSTSADEYHDLHRTIKNTPIKISDYDKHDIADWNDYRKQNFGNVTISRNGISIDSFYQELSSMYPHFFNSNRETSPSDQLRRINDVLNDLKPRTYTLTGKELDDAVDDLTLQIMNGYMIATRPKAA